VESIGKSRDSRNVPDGPAVVRLCAPESGGAVPNSEANTERDCARKGQSQRLENRTGGERFAPARGNRGRCGWSVGHSRAPVETHGKASSEEPRKKAEANAERDCARKGQSQWLDNRTGGERFAPARGDRGRRGWSVGHSRAPVGQMLSLP